MKLKYIASSIMVLLLQGACINAYSNVNHVAKPATKEQAVSERDGQIVALLITIDRNEMAAAKKSLKKSSSPAIKEYSNMLYQDHKRNLEETLKVSKETGIRPIESAKASTLKADGKREMAALSSLKGKEFDKAFIGAMVKGHRGALVILNKDAKKATNPAIRKLVLATTPAVKNHLQMAQKIQREEKKQ